MGESRVYHAKGKPLKKQCDLTKKTMEEYLKVFRCCRFEKIFFQTYEGSLILLENVLRSFRFVYQQVRQSRLLIVRLLRVLQMQLRIYNVKLHRVRTVMPSVALHGTENIWNFRHATDLTKQKLE